MRAPVSQPDATATRADGEEACALYLPGHNVHYIQARLSWESPDHTPGVIESIEGDIVRVRVNDEIRTYRNHDLSRVAQLSAETPEVVLKAHGVLDCQHHLVYIAPADDPWIPCRAATSEGSDSASLVDQLVTCGGFSVRTGEALLATDGDPT